jgi:DNA-directed RNA polymerase subunit L
MSKSSSFNSEELSDESLEEQDTKSQVDKEKDKEKEKAISTLKETIGIENLDLINSISKTLETILEKNKQLSNYKEIIKNQNKMYFSSYTIPTISIKEYLIRIQIYSDIESSTLILSLILIDKMCKRSGILLTYFNIHRILFSSLLISIKYNEDSFYNNTFYSQIAGVKPNELQLLEYTFLEYNDFNVFVKDFEYKQYEKYLITNNSDK